MPETKKDMKPTVGELDRVREFFKYCNDLEKHPFFLAHKDGGKVSVNFTFTPVDDKVESSFDDIHLESFLTRMRQFISPKEIFHVEKMQKDTEHLFGESEEFTEFCDKLKANLEKKFQINIIKVFGNNGIDLINGWTYKDLLEARLYSGALHSERKIIHAEDSIYKGFVDAHPAAIKHVEFELVNATLVVSQNIWSFRRKIYNAAVRAGKENIFPELASFGGRVKNK